MGCMMKCVVAIAAAIAIMLGGMLAAVALQQDHHEQHGDQQGRQDVPPGDSPDQGGFPDLVAGLKATPGCIGVETARTESGKNVIFAWFEDKTAALRWYYSDMHEQVMKQFFPHEAGEHEGIEHDPMADVPDGVPIMVIASITMADTPQFEATTLPISQIAVEMYTPVPGGIYLGGTFAPEELKVKGMENEGEDHGQE